MTYDNTNRGSLFYNDRKEKPTHADFKGKINVDGKEYWASMWVRFKKDVELTPDEQKRVAGFIQWLNGKGFFSVSVQSKDKAFENLEKKIEEKPFIDDSECPF